MNDLWQIPEGPHLIERLPVRVKPEWQGLVAIAVGFVLSSLERLTELLIAGLLTIVVGLFVPTPYGIGVAGAGSALLILAIVGLRLGLNDWATRILDRWIQVISGRIYVQRGRDLTAHPMGDSLNAHEWLHTWQQQQFGALWYVIGYFVSSRVRWFSRSRFTFQQHAEAMAYGLEVARYGRDPENAAISASDPDYGMRWSRAEARGLIDAYAKRFRDEWSDSPETESE